MSNEQKGTPVIGEAKKAGTFSIKVANPDGGDFVFEINPLSIDVYYAMMKLIRNGKTFEAYAMMIKSLKVSGDDPDILFTAPKYLPCLMALDEILAEMIQPANASIKKN